MTTESKSRVGRLLVGVAVVVVLAAAGFGVWWKWFKKPGRRAIREALFAELQPVALSNCNIARYGRSNDGGYLMCENLLSGATAAYSYGIEHEDTWGCAISERTGVVIHQYDCFTADRPTCPNGKFDFHSECIGPRAEAIDGRPYDTFTNQIARNGDGGKRLIVKMDVEGAEWDSLLNTSDEVLETIDQLSMELHGFKEPKYAELIRKLGRTFYLVNLHANNWSCAKSANPLSSEAYEVLFVNKRLGILDPSKPGRTPGTPPDEPNNAAAPDCQPTLLP